MSFSLLDHWHYPYCYPFSGVVFNFLPSSPLKFPSINKQPRTYTAILWWVILLCLLKQCMLLHWSAVSAVSSCLHRELFLFTLSQSVSLSPPLFRFSCLIYLSPLRLYHITELLRFSCITGVRVSLLSFLYTLLGTTDLSVHYVMAQLCLLYVEK